MPDQNNIAAQTPKKDNRPEWSEGEIPDILEWKLDVLMAQLARLGGGEPSDHNPIIPNTTHERLRDPTEFDPLEHPFPERPGISKILEWKLDVIMALLAKGNAAFPAIFILFTPLIWVIGAGLGAIIALLILIILLLMGILTALNAILVLILFVVVQIAVPYIISRNKKRLERYLATI